MTNMKRLEHEEKRALNIIWNASDNYSLSPELEVFDENGKADLYGNFIAGAVYKYYDYALLKKYFAFLRTDSDHDFFEKLFWIGLENSTYLAAKKERPILAHLRHEHAKKVLNGDIPKYERAILDEVRKVHFKRVLGLDADTEPRIIRILEELEFDVHMSTEEIIGRMNEIIKKYFKFQAGSYEISSDKYREKKMPNALEHSRDSDDDSENPGNALMKDMVIESAETTRDFFFEQDEDLKVKNLDLRKINIPRISADRSYIQKYYGSSILPEHRIAAMEKILCTGNHKRSRLHFTRGEFDNSTDSDADARYVRKLAKEQRKSNVDFYYGSYSRHSNSIANLTNRIRNTMLVNFESTVVKSKTGRIDANRIWRSIHVNDSKVFSRELKNDIGNITVDILLDSSASQCERQEIIAAQGYIIAESLTRCEIPVKVYSYCSLRGYTIINVFRDYEETKKNDKIFDYRSSGSNRDGLAVRTAVHMMESAQSENKILILLSDCKPNDIEINPGTGIIPHKTEYSGIKGVNDTAYEVKKGAMKGNSILCVFTGEDEDVASAKKIFGRNFVRISTLERFADIVGVLLQNQLRSL
ncbi:hypothetical protein [Sedimentibacter sp. LTW-03]|uniref:hypothetical protein n=1 Tax=Sedimentibacter sp. LTW-03 TaxID=3453406 RepID=UPI003F8264C9